MADRSVNFAAWDDVAATYKSHIKHYATHGGGENALVGLRAEGAVTLQYAGRVVYELFQNALDRAHRRVVVTFIDGLLLIGNDGDGIRVDPSYDYSKPIEGEGRSDFHALCALHTSNKSADRQFGNKGIGFRSVFGVTDHVTLWSRCREGGWWGMELRQKLVPTRWLGSALPELDGLVLGAGTQPRPSFHFPRLLRSSEDPTGGCADINTIVLVKVVDSQHQQQIEHEVDRLRKTRFQFVGLRRSNVNFHINGDVIASDSGWPLVSQAHHHAGFADLAELARNAGHPVEKPKIGVAWTEGDDDDKQTGLFYNYLPTRMSTGLPIDIHGDFQVKADREGMALAADNAVGAYNLALLRRAAEAHVKALRAEANMKESARDDFWLLANRPQNAPPAWTDALRKELFPSKGFDVWTELAASYFTPAASQSSCRSFWNASLRWVEVLAGYGHWTKTWAALARKLCDKLEEAGVSAIPVIVDDDVQAVELPSRQKPGKKAARRVFYWSPRGEASIPPAPQVLLDRGRVVTSFELGHFTKPAGVQPFAESELLPELRQVPNDPTKLNIKERLSPAEQASLLLFAYRLTATRRASKHHFAWRAFDNSPDGERIGRALATMFLPTIDAHWEPARQLSRDRVDMRRLADLMEKPEELLEEFVTLLGVAPTDSVALVEGGSEGRVAPLPSPPRPQEAGQISQIPPLEPLLLPGTDPLAVFRTVNDLPPDSPPDRPRSQVHQRVRSFDWIDTTHFRTFDGIRALRPFIAPQDIVLHTHDPHRIFFGVPQNKDDAEIFRVLGARHSPDDEVCVGRVPEILSDLHDRIPCPSDLPASIGLDLEAIFNRLMARLADQDRDIPTLVKCAGHLKWLEPGDEAWVARREERNEIRRFFPDLALVTTDHSKRLAEKLGVGEVRLRKRVRPDVDRRDATPRSSICKRIDPYLPHLAAVADQSSLATPKLSTEWLRRAWQLQQPVVEVEDAWVEIRVEGPDRETRSWRKQKFGDVFYLPTGADEDPGVVIFDIDPNKQIPDRQLPLRRFGNALARLLVNNAALGPLFSQVLASIDEGRIEDFIERNHLDALIREWRPKLQPLSSEEHRLLVEPLQKVCIDPNEALKTGRIAVKHLHPDLPHTGAPELEKWLMQQVPTRLASYLPPVVVAADNQRDWRQWLRRRRSVLSTLIETMGDLPSTWKKELESVAEQAWDSLRFDAASVAADYLDQYGHRIADLDRRLDEIVPTFAAVTNAPLPPSQTGLRVGHGRTGAGHGGPHQKLTTEGLIEESLARGAIGDAAERALLTWVVEQVTALRDVEGFEDALLSVFNPKSKTWRDVKEAIRADNLRSALHIASKWSGAGFDILGLEFTESGLIPVRYECKGISGSAPRTRIYLSRNELGVARRVRREGPGKWLLVGVQPDGACVDLTGFLEELLEESEKPLKPLYELGLEPDGLRVILERQEVVGASSETVTAAAHE